MEDSRSFTTEAQRARCFKGRGQAASRYRYTSFRLNSAIHERGYAREGFALQELQGGAAAC